MPLALLTPAPPCPTGPGSGNGVSAGASPGPCQPPCAQTKPSPPGLWGGGEWVRELTKRAGGAAPGARATPSPTCPERPHPLLPLGRSAGALGTVAMAAALGKLQLGNYCEHPSCLLPALESRGTSSQGQGSPSSHAGWPHPGLARCPPEVRRGGKHAGSKSRQASSSSRGPGDPQFPFYPHLWPTLGADQPAWNLFFLATNIHTTYKNNQRGLLCSKRILLVLFWGSESQ